MIGNTSILLGVTGSVAAFKAVDLTRRLREYGASVTVIMTNNATRFITPLSLELASEKPVITGLFNDPLSHVKVPANSDAFIIAPASANIIGKCAAGIADDILSTAYLAFEGKMFIAPAMNWRMWNHPAVRENVQILEKRGVQTIGPEDGRLACGETGTGKMATVETIIEAVRNAFIPKDYAGETVLVTAGPTREYFDPVRFISNRSSGKMGYAIARASAARGASVILISGPVSIEPPQGVKTIFVETADEMHAAVMEHISLCRVLVMTAAVADYRPVERGLVKRAKSEDFSPAFEKTPDILREACRIPQKPFVVGFSAETGPRYDRAREKLKSKGCDMVVFNDVSVQGSGFDSDSNEVVLITNDQDGTISEEALPLMPKGTVAHSILDAVRKRINHPAGHREFQGPISIQGESL